MDSESIYDSGALSPDENKPIKSFSRRTKKTLKLLLSAAIGIGLAVAAIIIFRTAFTGASTPEKAAAEYIKASLIYDVDGMIDYSSPYNKTVLCGLSGASDGYVKDYLKKAYEQAGTETGSAENIRITHIDSVEYKEGDDRFEEYLQTYAEKADRDEVSAVARVTLAVYNGKKESTHVYLAVKIGPAWYYFYTAK